MPPSSTLHRPIYLHLLFWSGMRPSEAAGLQWHDVDLERGTAEVRRSRHLWTYGEPKTAGARRTVQLFPETVRLLRALQPLRVDPTTPVFPNTRGAPIEPNSFLPHWYAAQRALGLRLRGLYSTKDTFVTTALDAGVKFAWLETQTGSTTSRFGATTGSGCRTTAGASWSSSPTSIRRSLVEELCRTQSQLCRGLGAGRVKLGKKTCERGDLNPHGVATTGS